MNIALLSGTSANVLKLDFFNKQAFYPNTILKNRYRMTPQYVKLRQSVSPANSLTSDMSDNDTANMTMSAAPVDNVVVDTSYYVGFETTLTE